MPRASKGRSPFASFQGSSVAILLLTLCWVVSVLLVLMVAVAERMEAPGAPARNCRVTEVLTPRGLGTLDRNENGSFALQVNPGNGRGLAVFPGLARKLERCPGYLAFSTLEIPVGYEVSLFHRDASGVLRRTPIQSAWSTKSVYDLEALFDTPVSSASEWGLSVQPVHQDVPGAHGSAHALNFSKPELTSASWQTVLANFATDWTAFRPWTGKSINVLSDAGGHAFPWNRPAFMLGISLAPALLVGLALFRRKPRYMAAGIALPVILSWILVDASWHRNLVQQQRETSLLYRGRDAGALADTSDERLASIAHSTRAAIGESNRPVLVVAPEHFQRTRLYYHLLPLRAAPVSHGLERLHYGDSPERLDGAWLVVLEGPEIHYDAAQGRLEAGGGASIPVDSILREEGWALLRIQVEPAREQPR